MLYLYPVISNLINGNSSYGGDTRGGQTGIVGQLSSIIQHPLAFIKMLIHDIFTMDNFRNFSDPSKNKVSVLNLMFLNLYNLGSLKDAWSLVLFPLLLLIFLVEPKGEPTIPTHAFLNKCRILNTIIVVCSVILVWLAMYLTFTPIGQQSIEGVQARYFLPLFLPVSYAVWNRRLHMHVSRTHYFQIVWGMGLLLICVCFYATLIAGRII